MQAIDEPSAALFALLANQATAHRLLIAATVRDDARPTNPRAGAHLQAVSALRELKLLSAADSECLLSSAFCVVPRVRLLADRLHSAGEGNPGALMELGQHLVATGVVRYEGGAWHIPERFEPSSFPERAQQALRVRLAALPADALELAAKASAGAPTSSAPLRVTRSTRSACAPACI